LTAFLEEPKVVMFVTTRWTSSSRKGKPAARLGRKATEL